MKNTSYKKILLIFLFLTTGHYLQAQEGVSKTIEKNYEFTNAGEMHLENKYGDITVTGWDQNKVQIIIDITVIKENKEDAKNLLKRIKPSIITAEHFMNVFVNIEEKNQGFLSRIINTVNPFDLDKGSVQIDFDIKLPSNADIQIINKFGDVIINDWYGKLNTKLQHGDMWINNDLNNASIELKYGKLNAKSITYCDIELKNSEEFNLVESKDLKIASNGSNINIAKITNLEIYSSKDKIYIKHIERAQGELEFSNMQVEEINEDINLNLEVADLFIHKITKPNPNITLKQESSELNINIANLSFDFKASLEQGLLRIPKSFSNIETNMINKGNRLRDITASYGNEKRGTFTITGKKGVIILKEK